jgi:hypothetical protein
MDAADGGGLEQVTANGTGQHISLGWQPLPVGTANAGATAAPALAARLMVVAMLAALVLG